MKKMRFIPTHVGNTASSLSNAFHGPVHPHACGKHVSDAIKNNPDAGSSPRMWETLRTLPRIVSYFRFIPTHVGNTRFKTTVANNHTVHPHACGKHQVDHQQVGGHHGSSPRMWETQNSDRCNIHKLRFIPTHVGNTFKNFFLMRRQIGSSPRMWETPFLENQQRSRSRFIPTHVGNTCIKK